MSKSETVMNDPEAKDARLEARTSSAQKALFEKAAALQGVSLTDFMLTTLYEAATRIVSDRQTLRLGDQDRKVFVEALLSAAAPGEKLEAAARRYKKRTKA